MPGLVDCGVVLRTALPSGNAFFTSFDQSLQGTVHFLHSIRYIKFLDLQLRESVIRRSSLVAEKEYLSVHLEMPDGGLGGVIRSRKVLLTSRSRRLELRL